MTSTHRVRRSYDHRLRDAIAATGNAYPFRNVPIPASTRRTWVQGEVRPVVASVDVELEVYELLEQVDQLRQRAKQQAAIIGLLVRLLKLRGVAFVGAGAFAPGNFSLDIPASVDPFRREAVVGRAKGAQVSLVVV